MEKRLTLVCTVHQASSPVQNPRSWQSYGPIETCYLASNLDEQLSESEYTQHLLPFVSCNSVLPAPWLCHGISVRASSSVKQNNTISIFIFLIIRYYMIRIAMNTRLNDFLSIKSAYLNVNFYYLYFIMHMLSNIT